MNVVEQLQKLSEAQFLSIYEALSSRVSARSTTKSPSRSISARRRSATCPSRSEPSARGKSWPASAARNCATSFSASYLIKDRQELVTGFLDATGVKHEKGMVEDLENALPNPQKVAAAVAELDQKFSPSDVTLYLSMCADQWPQLPEIEAIWRQRVG